MVDCPANLSFRSRPQVEPVASFAPQPMVGDYVSPFIGNDGHIDRKKGIRDIKNEGASGYVDENTCWDKMSWLGADLCASIRAGNEGRGGLECGSSSYRLPVSVHTAQLARPKSERR